MNGELWEILTAQGMPSAFINQVAAYTAVKGKGITGSDFLSM
jgi:hypothetical protein